MLYVGIDPGESWCGFAALDITSDNTVRVESRTYNVQQHGGWLSMSRDLLNLLPHARRAFIIAEDFRIRRSGHQHFSHGDTLRFLGALEFGVSAVTTYEFALIPPNDHGEKETREFFGKVLLRYRQQWPKRGNAAWYHCLSAWRVLGRHLVRYEPNMLWHLSHSAKRSQRCERWLPTASRPTHDDFIAPAALWLKQFQF